MGSVDEGYKEAERNLEMIRVMYIGSPWEVWLTLTKIATETREAAYDRAKREFESLEIGVSETAAEYFARVHTVLTKLTRRQRTTPVHPQDKTEIRTPDLENPNVESYH